MKSFYVAIAALGFAAAQDYAGQPKCIIPCIEAALPGAGCAIDDVACGCRPDVQAKMMGPVASCAAGKCTAEELLQAQKAAADTCAHLPTSSKKEEQHATTTAAPAPAKSSHGSAAPQKTVTRCNNGTVHSTGHVVRPTHTPGPVVAGAVAPAAAVLPVLLAAAIAL